MPPSRLGLADCEVIADAHLGLWVLRPSLMIAGRSNERQRVFCGADKKFVRAEAVIEGNMVVVRSDKVPNPVAVRYAWERNPECNLFSKDALPASPFRSDEFVNFFTHDGG